MNVKSNWQTGAFLAAFTLMVLAPCRAAAQDGVVAVDVLEAGAAVPIDAGRRVRLTCAAGGDRRLRLWETTSGFQWYDGPAQAMGLAFWAIRAGDIPLTAALEGSEPRRFALRVEADNDNTLYPGLEMALALAPTSGPVPLDPAAFGPDIRSAAAIPASRAEYEDYPAFRTAESVLPRLDERSVHNFRKPDFWRMLVSQLSMSDDPEQIVAWGTAVVHPAPDLNRAGVMAQLRGKLLVDMAGPHRFRVQTSIPVHIRIGPETLTSPVTYQRNEKGEIVPRLISAEATIDLQAGLADAVITLDARQAVPARLHLAWQPPGAATFETLDGGRFLHVVSPAAEAAYQTFTGNTPWRNVTAPAGSAAGVAAGDVPQGALTSAAASRESYLDVSRKLLDAWQRAPADPNAATVARTLMQLQRMRMAVLRKEPSQRLPGTFANKIDGDTLVLFEDMRGLLEACLRHPLLQREALATRAAMHSYTALIHSRSFFAEAHFGTNDGYGDHNNFLVNVWRGARAWDDPVAFDMARSLYDNHFSDRPGRGEGLHADDIWSFHNANGRHINMGGYGRDWIRRTLNDLHFGTPYGNTPEQYRRMADFVLAWEWFFYRGAKAFTVAGRHNTHEGDMNPEYAQRLLDLPEGALSDATRERVRAQKNRLAGDGALQGNRFFYRHLQMIHRRQDYYLDVKMNSPLVGGVETFAGAQPGNLSFGDGVTTILRHGDEYRAIHAYNIPESLWRFRALPGTTQLDLEWGNLTKWQELDRYRRGGGNTAGGVSNGDGGHCAFDFVSHQRNATRAKKFFAFNDAGMLVLGSGISGSKEAPSPRYSYRSTINQCHFRKPVQIVDASGKTMTVGAAETDRTVTLPLNQRYWIEHDGVAYIVFPSDGASSLVVRTSIRTPINRLGPDIWDDPKMAEYRKQSEALLQADPPRRVPVLEIWIDHGPKPTNATCAYVVCMRPDARPVSDWLSAPPFTILANTPTLQAARDDIDGIVHAFFHGPGVLSRADGAGLLASREPASVMVTALEVLVQDPRAACAKDLQQMSDVIHLTVRKGDAQVDLAVPMPGAGDPDDRNRGGIARQAW